MKKDVLRLKDLKLKSYSKLKKDDILFLEKEGIINGVGPEQYGRLLRLIMTKLFGFLDFRRHDINFRIGGTEKDFEKANYGILKYSFISLANEYKEIYKKHLKKLYLIPRFYILLPFKVLIILFSYNACMKLGRKAFNFH